MLLCRILQCSFNSVKTYIQKLLSIFLDSDVCGLPIEFFETEAEWGWIVILTVWELQECKLIHHLMQNIIINVLVLMFDVICFDLIISCHQTESKCWNIVKLLHHWVHIANCPKIFDTTETMIAPRIGLRREPSSFWLVNSINLFKPVIFQNLIDYIGHLAVFADDQQKIIWSLFAILSVAFIDIFLLYFFKINFFGDVLLDWFEIKGKQAFLQNELDKLLNFFCVETSWLILKKHRDHVNQTY